MRARLLLVVALSMLNSLLLLASSCQATPLHLGQNGRTRLAPFFLEPPSSEFGRRNIDHDLHGSKAQNDDHFGQALSSRPIAISKRSSSDQRAHMDYTFFKRGDGHSDGHVAEEISASEDARKASDSVEGASDRNDATAASVNHDDVFKEVVEVRKEVTKNWTHFKKVLEHRRSNQLKRRNWRLSNEINKYVDKLLGPPSTSIGDDFSRLNFTNVPPKVVKEELKKFENAFANRYICGWAKARAIRTGRKWQISVLRYVPEGGWRDASKTTGQDTNETTSRKRKRRKTTPESSSSSQAANVVKGPKEVKFNFERLGWSSDEKVELTPWLIKGQWLSRPEGDTDLIFFNVPKGQAARVRTLITEKWGSNDIPEVEELYSEKEGMCLLRLSGKDEFRFVY
ncbi:hypothetical protein FA10DRAFT_288772 [Acaromyces ingoldii]|uniref:Uncharacterized protein n=1 Tax=Acaromyces ingoldii TaxID=215250 RepID=A0A316YDX5_9BASI|nr:hypothetical protein FA10DRAFT_288772 [Acaromyces ingoldii]PWN87331.1 hypothetical protein FA10DRAFT_288772 [Acaromyces ingoldii]